MPFTPFHIGPGAAIKAAIPRHFSFTVFCLAQIVIDSEVAVYLALGDYQIHRHFHTYLGATVIGLLCAVVGRPLCQFGLRVWIHWKQAPFKQSFHHYFPVSADISLPAAFSGAFIGTYSHIVLDSFMHRDMRPFAPFSDANPLLGSVSLLSLHLFCLVTGIIGALIVARRG